MDSNRRTLELLFQDMIASWGEMHNWTKAVRVLAEEMHTLASKAENGVDVEFALLMKTVNDQLEGQAKDDNVDQG